MVEKVIRKRENCVKCYVILLAGGSGTRMNSGIPKQFMEVAGKPLIRYSLDTIEKSADVECCILVTAQKDFEYMQRKILIPGKYTKVKALAPGGRERYESVLNGLKELRRISPDLKSEDVVMIHDGARPFLTDKMIRDCAEAAEESGACVAAVPSKDTVAISDADGFESMVPERKTVWIIQTPQAFRAVEVFQAFEDMEEDMRQPDGREKLSWITDDAAVVEYYNGTKIRLVEGDYRNMKVTTPEDIKIAESLIK